jgi:hypothetical protein
MNNFSGWIREECPEFFDEGLLQPLRHIGKKAIKGVNTVSAGLGLASRTFAPLIAAAGISSASPDAMSFDSKSLSTTQVPITQTLKQYKHDDAEDYIPLDQAGRHRRHQKASFGMGNRQFSTGFVDPNWRPAPVSLEPEQPVDPTVPEKPRLTPIMKAKILAKMRKLK